MSKYVISWTEEDWYQMEVEADSKQDALDKFHQGEYSSNRSIRTESGILQEGADIWEVE